jgi:hypothetical protein
VQSGTGRLVTTWLKESGFGSVLPWKVSCLVVWTRSVDWMNPQRAPEITSLNTIRTGSAAVHIGTTETPTTSIFLIYSQPLNRYSGRLPPPPTHIHTPLVFPYCITNSYMNSCFRTVSSQCKKDLRQHKQLRLTVSELYFNLYRDFGVRGCMQKFPDWPPGGRTANGTALCH